MADYQIGDNLYANAQGKYYRLNNGQQAFEESPFDTMSNKLNVLYDTQKKSQLDQLKAQRDKAISGFNQQKKDLAPQYQNQRNQADVVNAQNVSRLRELMAAQGINASGENLTTQASMASSRQNALGEIDNNEAYAIRGIDQQIANENDPSREQAIINAIEAERSGKLSDAYNQSQQDIFQRYQDYRNYQEQLKAAELQRQQFEWQKQMEQQQLALQKQASARSAASSSRSSSSKTSTAKAPKLTKQQSFAEASQYFAGKKDDIKQQGAYRYEQNLLSDPAAVQQFQAQGYDMGGVIDALYNTLSDGKFATKGEYSRYVADLNKKAIKDAKR